MKNKTTIYTIAVVCFAVIPYIFLGAGGTEAALKWTTVEAINRFLLAVRGFGFACMVYFMGIKQYRAGLIVAALSDLVPLYNAIIASGNFIYSNELLIALLTPFIMWLACLLLGLILPLNGKRTILLSIVASLVYWIILVYLNRHIYVNLNIILVCAPLILGANAMKQLKLV